MNKSYIWTLPTRVFHWLFVVTILIAFLTDDDKLLFYHAIAGYCIFILLVFRFSWGFMGPKFSKFKDFDLNIKSMKTFIKSLFIKNSEYLGHNPVASYIMIGMLIVTTLIIITGAFTYGIEEKKGLFSFLSTGVLKDFKSMDKIHEFFANLLLFLIGLHLTGVLLDKLLHKQKSALISIFNGYKISKSKLTIKLNLIQKIFALIMLILLIAFIFFNIIKPNNTLVSSNDININTATISTFFV
ncbi:cytochrome b/b6 domain-containing protein [Arcobacter sp. CECT 8985]|uniref:cytochrome b/b6 domain-containing protein n=1 Tax=Arcobacter sp. CECT 8985 TaxID=1935424 RepID=UPI00100B913C|nr:cytochrome b/b6 domain-containing protein [Arcobacter sp. CECT 8985]RXJ86138.1 cytochrome B [Arcobacter sp. CECT 8985]